MTKEILSPSELDSQILFESDLIAEGKEIPTVTWTQAREESTAAEFDSEILSESVSLSLSMQSGDTEETPIVSDTMFASESLESSEQPDFPDTEEGYSLSESYVLSQFANSLLAL